jgi:hypothetical protein
MIPAIALKFVAGLLGPKFGKFAAPLIYALAALVLVGAFLGLKSCYDSGVVDKHEQKIEQRAKPATDQAAAERSKDAITQAKNEEEMHNAIHSVPDAAPAGPSHALACKRLRDHGRHPAACGGPASRH